MPAPSSREISRALGGMSGEVVHEHRLHASLTDDGLAPRSVEKALGVLRRILDHARAGDLIGENPVRRWAELRPTTARRRSARIDRTVTTRDVFTATELEALL